MAEDNPAENEYALKKDKLNGADERADPVKDAVMSRQSLFILLFKSQDRVDASGGGPVCPRARRAASGRDLFCGPLRRLVRFVDGLLGGFFSARPRFAFAAQILDLFVRQMFDTDH